MPAAAAAAAAACSRVHTSPSPCEQLTYKEGPLAPQATIRGAYINTASKVRQAGTVRPRPLLPRRELRFCSAAAADCRCPQPTESQCLPDINNLTTLWVQDVGIDPDFHKIRKDPIVGNAPLQHPGK